MVSKYDKVGFNKHDFDLNIFAVKISGIVLLKASEEARFSCKIRRTRKGPFWILMKLRMRHWSNWNVDFDLAFLSTQENFEPIWPWKTPFRRWITFF